MKKSFYCFFVLIGLVIGSGFLSGKEIVVFFSRFGVMSFPCIIFATLLFFGLFLFMLSYGVKAVKRLEKSKFSNIINIIICIILSSAMFAGIYDVLSEIGLAVAILGFLVIILACYFINKKGLGSLEKANFYLVPIMLFMLLINVVSLIRGKSLGLSFKPYYCAGIYYSVMYVILNTANSGVLLAHIGSELTHKQKVRVSLASALVLGIILLLTNIVLLQNPDCFNEDMPLISLFTGFQGALMQVVVLIGCLTTLFSVVFTLCKSLKGLFKDDFISNFSSISIPLAISFLGFGNIVSCFYPISSVLGIFLICDLFLLPFLKQTHKSIHSSRNGAQKHNARHDDI